MLACCESIALQEMEVRRPIYNSFFAGRRLPTKNISADENIRWIVFGGNERAVPAVSAVCAVAYRERACLLAARSHTVSAHACLLRINRFTENAGTPPDV